MCFFLFNCRFSALIINFQHRSLFRYCIVWLHWIRVDICHHHHRSQILILACFVKCTVTVNSSSLTTLHLSVVFCIRFRLDWWIGTSALFMANDTWCWLDFYGCLSSSKGHFVLVLVLVICLQNFNGVSVNFKRFYDIAQLCMPVLRNDVSTFLNSQWTLIHNIYDSQCYSDKKPNWLPWAVH